MKGERSAVQRLPQTVLESASRPLHAPAAGAGSPPNSSCLGYRAASLAVRRQEERWYTRQSMRLLRPLGGPRISQIRPASSGQGVTRAALHACFPPMTHGSSIHLKTGELAYLGFITSSDVASFPREGSCRVRIVLYSPAVLRVVLRDILPCQDSRVSPLLS